MFDYVDCKKKPPLEFDLQPVTLDLIGFVLLCTFFSLFFSALPINIE